MSPGCDPLCPFSPFVRFVKRNSVIAFSFFSSFARHSQTPHLFFFASCVCYLRRNGAHIHAVSVGRPDFIFYLLKWILVEGEKRNTMPAFNRSIYQWTDPFLMSSHLQSPTLHARHPFSSCMSANRSTCRPIRQRRAFPRALTRARSTKKEHKITNRHERA
jgi:hypothetical protein